MKKLITIVFTLSVILYLSSATAYTQGKGQGQGRGPAVPGGVNRGPEKHEDRAARNRENKPADKAQNRQEKFEARLEKNPALRTKLESMLPAGTNLNTAASGFKNQGQFIAALHVSKNLNIPFDQLKSKMTGPNALSLGQAIHELKPTLPENEAKKEAERAERQAKTTGKVKSTTT